MPLVSFTSALKRFYPDLSTMEVTASTVAELLEKIERRHPGLKDYLVDERGRLRNHVNIYIGQGLIEDRETLRDPVGSQDKILIFQALSGG